MAEDKAPQSEPTHAEAMQISQAGVEAVVKSETKDPHIAQQTAEAAMKNKADALNRSISDEDAKKIAQVTIGELRHMGAFESSPEPASQSRTEPTNEEKHDGNDQLEIEEPPRKKSFAEKYFSER